MKLDKIIEHIQDHLIFLKIRDLRGDIVVHLTEDEFKELHDELSFNNYHIDIGGGTVTVEGRKPYKFATIQIPQFGGVVIDQADRNYVSYRVNI